MWKNNTLNIITDNILTVLYGFPVFAWIPTHNTNHHVHINKDPDYTKTYMISEKNNLLTLMIYPSISGAVQQKRSLAILFPTGRLIEKDSIYNFYKLYAL